MRPGARIAVDVGTVRVGVAASDPAGTLAFPIAVLRRGASDVAELADVVRDRAAVEVVVGLPQTLRGRDSGSTEDARAYAAAVAAAVAPVPVRLVDERLTTVTAARQLRQAGRDARKARSVVDAAAAVVVLENALERERLTGEPAGELVTPL